MAKDAEDDGAYDDFMRNFTCPMPTWDVKFTSKEIRSHSPDSEPAEDAMDYQSMLGMHQDLRLFSAYSAASQST